MMTVVMPAALYVGPNAELRRDVWITPSADASGAPSYEVHMRNPLDPQASVVLEETPHRWHAEAIANHWNQTEF